jgi:pyridoxamine 5'-phosphate oxidase family protein
MFSEKETEYLRNQKLGGIATVAKSGQPDVVPVGFEFDGSDIWIGSGTQEIFLITKKYLNVINGNSKVAFVVDDLESVDPWRPRSLKIYGIAEVQDHAGRMGTGKYLKITPTVSWSFGINERMPDYKQPSARSGNWRTKTVHQPKSA